jgi:hypothetical protein
MERFGCLMVDELAELLVHIKLESPVVFMYFYWGFKVLVIMGLNVRIYFGRYYLGLLVNEFIWNLHM